LAGSLQPAGPREELVLLQALVPVQALVLVLEQRAKRTD
jgi:hypothetical protein